MYFSDFSTPAWRNEALYRLEGELLSGEVQEFMERYPLVVEPIE